MPNDDILCSFFNIIKVQVRELGKKYSNGRYAIRENVIYEWDTHKITFIIMAITFYDKRIVTYNDFLINKCVSPKKCDVTLLCPDKCHFHGTYIDSSGSQLDDDDFVVNSFILVIMS